MIDSAPRTTDCSRWVHYLAVLTVCATLPLLVLGAEVTTRGVGMVDPKGFRWPWEILALLGQGDNAANSALVIELTHRQFGFLVGILAIGLCAGLWLTASGPKRWLGLAVLAAVVAQGLLGRYRVDLNALFGSTLALIHGCFAQLVLALMVSTALVTSRMWSARHEQPEPPDPLCLAPTGPNMTAQGNALGTNALKGQDNRSATLAVSALQALFACGVRLPRALPWAVLFRPVGAQSQTESSTGAGNRFADLRLRHWSLVVTLLVFLQILLGAIIRHKQLALGLRAHFVVAFVVVAAVVWLWKLAHDSADRLSPRTAGLLTGLVAFQVFLGLETWLSKLVVTWPGTLERVEPFALPAELIRSAHYLVGALIFATSVATALLAHRQIQWQARTAPSEKAEAALGGVT